MNLFKHKEVYVGLLLVFLMVPISHAGTITVNVQPENVWIKSGTVTIKVNCTSSGGVLNAYYSIHSPISTENITMSKDDQGIFVSEFSTTPYTGKYEGTAYCEVNESGSVYLLSESFQFEARDLVVSSIRFDPSPAYTDEKVKIVVNVTVVGATAYTPSSAVSFVMKVDGVDVPLSAGDYYFYNNLWYIAPELNLSAGRHVFEIKVLYEGISTTSTASLELHPPLRVTAVDVSGKIVPAGNITINMGLDFKGTPVSLFDVSLHAFLGGRDVSDKVAIADENTIILTLPEKPPGTYTLELRISYNGYTTSARSTLEYPARFSASFKTPDNKALSGKISFKRGGYEKSYTVNGNANFLLPPATYDVVLSNFAGIKQIEIKSVEMDESADDFLKYDVLSGDFKLEGIKPAGGIAIEIALPFSSAEIEMKYDSKKINDEDALLVYACHRWNFYARKCAGEWEQIDARVDTIRDIVKFQTNKLSAFVVGEPGHLEISANVDKSEVFMGEELTISGIIRDDGKNPVGYARITYEFNGKSGTVDATKDGVFLLKLKAPEEEGNYTVKLTASKGVYVPTSTVLEINVVAKKELSIILPEKFSMSVGENATLHIKLVNTGQKPIVGLKIKVSGLPAGSYKLSKDTIDVISVDDVKIVDLLLMPSEGQDGSYPFTITLSSPQQGYVKSASMLVEYKKKSTLSQIKEIASSSSSGDKITSKIIGFFDTARAQILSLWHVIVGLLIASIVFMLSRMSLVTRNQTNVIRRREVINSLEGIKLEIEKGKERMESSAYVCEKCGSKFRSKRAYSIHKVKAHGGKR